MLASTTVDDSLCRHGPVSEPARPSPRSFDETLVKTVCRTLSMASSLYLRSGTGLKSLKINSLTTPYKGMPSHSWFSVASATDVWRGRLVYRQTNSISRQTLHEGRPPSHFVLRARHESHARAVRRLFDRLSSLPV